MANERDSMPEGDPHRRPEGVDDATVEAVGKLGEALECVERCRGALYTFHQLSGHADFLLEDAADALDKAGHGRFAERLRDEVVGRNVIAGRWTFQIVEEYDDGYYETFRQLERHARDTLAGGRRHLYEAELKEQRRSHGQPGHEARPS